MPVDPGALDASIRRLQGVVPDHPDVEGSIQRVVDGLGALCHCSGTGLMLLAGDQVLHHVAASDHGAHLLQVAQEETGEGPCLDAVASGDVVRSADAGADDRWPQLATALHGRGVGAVLAAPVRIGDACVGSLDVHVDVPAEWDGTQADAVVSYAGLVEAVLTAALQAERRSTVVAQLQHALDHRVVVERAVGYLMASDGGDARTSFERLRSAARSSRRHVADLAAGLLEGQPLDRT